MFSIATFCRIGSATVSLLAVLAWITLRESLSANIVVFAGFISLIVLLQVVSDQFMVFLVDRIPVLRWRLLTANRIEGTYVDVVFAEDHEDPEEMQACSWVDVCWRQGEFFVEGWNFDASGKLLLHFTSRQCTWANKRLCFSYAYTGQDFGGYCEAVFRPARGSPEYIESRFLDVNWQGVTLARGKRIKHSRGRFGFRRPTEEERGRVAQQYLAEQLANKRMERDA